MSHASAAAAASPAPFTPGHPGHHFVTDLQSIAESFAQRMVAIEQSLEEADVNDKEQLQKTIRQLHGARQLFGAFATLFADITLVLADYVKEA